MLRRQDLISQHLHHCPNLLVDRVDWNSLWHRATGKRAADRGESKAGWLAA